MIWYLGTPGIWYLGEWYGAGVSSGNGTFFYIPWAMRVGRR